jgi:hypothetical protein
MNGKRIQCEYFEIASRFTVRNPFTATFSVPAARLCARLRVFARSAGFESRPAKKKTARSFYINS